MPLTTGILPVLQGQGPDPPCLGILARGWATEVLPCSLLRHIHGLVGYLSISKRHLGLF